MFQLEASWGTDNRFCDTALARKQTGSKYCVATSGYAGDLFTCAFRTASTDAGFSSADVSPRFSPRVSGADDPAHYLCVSRHWDVADKNNFALLPLTLQAPVASGAAPSASE